MNGTTGKSNDSAGGHAPGSRERTPAAPRADNPSPQPAGNPIIRWSDLPRALQIALDRTPRGQWYRIRPIVVQSPETHKILDIARLADQVLPRSTLGVRRKMVTKEERAKKVGELIENLDAFWSAVDALESAIEKVARAAGVYGIVEFRNRGRRGPPQRAILKPPATPAAPELPPAEFSADEDEAHDIA